MTRFDSPRVVTYAGLAAVGLLAGLVLGRVELVAVAAPFAIAAVVGAAIARDPGLHGAIALDRERALEEESVHLAVTLSGRADRVELLIPLPDELHVLGENPRALRLLDDRELTVDVQCERWGAFAIGPAMVRASDRFGFHRYEGSIGVAQQLRVYPAVETLTRCLRRSRRRSSWETKSRAAAARASSSPTSANGPPATGSGASTGAPRRDATPSG
jgi:uncharacterized protein (DUF58 family)